MTTDAKPTARRFVRLYYDDLERDYPDILFDPTCLSTYARLLMAADRAWPSLPELYRTVRRADLKKLAACGLIEIVPNGRYTMKGYAKERGDRTSKAKRAADARWNADADAVA